MSDRYESEIDQIEFNFFDYCGKIEEEHRLIRQNGELTPKGLPKLVNKANGWLKNIGAVGIDVALDEVGQQHCRIACARDGKEILRPILPAFLDDDGFFFAEYRGLGIAKDTLAIPGIVPIQRSQIVHKLLVDYEHVDGQFIKFKAERYAILPFEEYAELQITGE